MVYICHHKHRNQLVNNISVIIDVVDLSLIYCAIMVKSWQLTD